MDIPMYQEAGYHFLAGVAISLTDRFFSDNASRRSVKRKQEKLEQMAALQYLSDVEQVGEVLTLEEQARDKEEQRRSKDYLTAIVKARDYFQGQGKSVSAYAKGLKDLPNRVLERLESFKRKERINNLSLANKFAVAATIEFIGDGMAAVYQLSTGKGDGLVGFFETLYQGPAMFAGFLTGRGILYVKDFFRSSEEKETDRMLKEITADGRILEIVRNYSPASYVESHEHVEGDAGKKAKLISQKARKVVEEVADGIGEGVGGIFTDIKERMQTRIDQRVKEREERRKKLRSKYESY